MKTRCCRHAAIGAALLAATTLAQAQSMKPGLWEYSSTMKSASGEMEAAMAEAQKQMASMPPEQRKQFEQMMAAQGMASSPGGRGPQVTRVCVTPEEAANFDIQSDPQCKQEITQRSASGMKMRFACTGDGKTEGEGSISLRGDTAFTSNFVIKTQSGGKSDRFDMTQNGKWIGADCGKLKPRR